MSRISFAGRSRLRTRTRRPARPDNGHSRPRRGESTPQAAAPFTDADVMRITALPPAVQVEEVKQELKRCKPDFDGTLIPNLEAHEGAEARPPSRRYRLEKSVSALPGTFSAARLRPPHLRAYRNPANVLRSHRTKHLTGIIELVPDHYPGGFA